MNSEFMMFFQFILKNQESCSEVWRRPAFSCGVKPVHWRRKPVLRGWWPARARRRPVPPRRRPLRCPWRPVRLWERPVRGRRRAVWEPPVHPGVLCVFGPVPVHLRPDWDWTLQTAPPLTNHHSQSLPLNFSSCKPVWTVTPMCPPSFPVCFSDVWFLLGLQSGAAETLQFFFLFSLHVRTLPRF